MGGGRCKFLQFPLGATTNSCISQLRSYFILHHLLDKIIFIHILKTLGNDKKLKSIILQIIFSTYFYYLETCMMLVNSNFSLGILECRTACPPPCKYVCLPHSTYLWSCLTRPLTKCLSHLSSLIGLGTTFPSLFPTIPSKITRCISFS